MARGIIVVEGQGETDAAQTLVVKLWGHLGFPWLTWETRRGSGLLKRERVEAYAEGARVEGDCAAFLFLRDADDDCPAQSGPEAARWLVDLRLPFPAAVTLFRREYETLFLASLPSLRGRPLTDSLGRQHPGLRAEAEFCGDLEGPRDVKRIMRELMVPPGAYKPTTHQLPLTRLLDFNTLRDSALPSFGTLERALTYLHAHLGQRGAVYPSFACLE